MLLFTTDLGTLNSVTFYVGVFGWIAPFIGPSKLYEKSFAVPEPLPLPQRNENQAFINAIDYSITVPKQNRSSYTYTKYQNYLDKIGGIKKTFKDSLTTPTYMFEQSNINILAPFNYFDTNTTFF